MSTITVITPPDKIHNKNFSILLIYPNNFIKNNLQDIISQFDIPINVYMYEGAEDAEDWLLSVHRSVDVCILDLDSIPPYLKNIESYLISFGNTFYLTKGDNLYYNKISANKIYDLDFLRNKLGGNIETE